MNGNLLIGVDVGTTSTKVLIADPIGRVLASGTADYQLLFPHVGWAEQNPEDIFKGVKRAIKEAVSQIPKQSGEICAISFSTQRDTLVVTDENNVPLRNAITWLDSRAGEECERLKRDVGEDTVYTITGVPISTIWTGAFLLWLRTHEPEVWGKAACFGLVHDYLMCCFGAKEHYLDMTNACQTMFYDFVNNEWSEPLLSYMGITAEHLPKLVKPTQTLGTLSPELAKELNLSPEIRLIAGGGDQQCAMLGSGAIRQGDTEVCIGTAANILAALETPQLDESHQLICHRSLIPNNYVLEGAMLSTGKLIEWIADVFYPGEDKKNFYLKLNYEVATNSHPGANGLLITPHFEGAASPHWNYDARGVCLGLTLTTDRADICRAVLEGISLEMLYGHELLFRGSQFGAVATVEPKPGACVPVLVWKIKPSDERALDLYEGYPHLYRKENLSVTMDGGERDIMAYVMTGEREYGVPARSYYETIARGYADAGFDTGVLNEAVQESVRRMRDEMDPEEELNETWQMML